LQFCCNSVVAKNSQPINRSYVDLDQDFNQSQRSVTELAAHGAARRSSASAVANGVNNNKWTESVAISLPEVTTNKIYTFYGTMWELYTKKNQNNCCMHAWCCGMTSYVLS